MFAVVALTRIVEGVRIFMFRDGLLSLRSASFFDAPCEWFGLGWTEAPSPLVSVFCRPLADEC